MIAGVLLLAAVASADPGNLCTMCHPEQRVQFERSIHQREEIRCVSCHGGDPSASTVAAAHRAGFRGKIRRAEIPDLCGSCHADTAKMRPYNLPTDQLALYRTSAHGRALARGDDRVAVCIDCHGVHHILRHEDPGSTVFPSTIPKTCGRCHSDAGLMRPRGHDGNPFEEYAAGVHGQALLEHGDSSAPDCARCHGAHGAAPPGVGDVDKVCGQCHAATRAQFLESPHRRVMAAAGLPECASCHGNHRVGRADIALLDTVCLKCHDAKSTAVNLATRMKALHTGASEELERARRTVQRASEVPIYVEDYRARLEEARTSLIESLPAMHSLDLARVEQLTHRARSLGAEVESEVGGKLGEMKWRRVGLGVFWLYLLVTVAILARFRTRAARRESA